ncbi:MAG: sigma-54-dependent Fis family transcriptional regulator [Nitrospinae bacterium]|nr:sigma-54-dependent Fis family transcriptional regulator [Nitrospinota bacterium]
MTINFTNMQTPKTLYQDKKILLVDDDKDVLLSLSASLRIAGYRNVVALDDSRRAMDALERDRFSLVLLDLLMPHVSGKDLLENIVEAFPDIPVVVVTAVDDLDSVVSCIRAGAQNYLLKPVRESRLLATVENALRIKVLEDENQALKKKFFDNKPAHPEAFQEIITVDPRMEAIFSYLEAIAGTPYPILITGESGTGKELIAGSIRKLSGCKGEFIAVNVAGLDDALLSDVLFGHKKGAFTGADRDRDGLLRKAENGCVFLDEIGDMEVSSQLKLLRLLQHREYHPIGSDQIQKTNAKFVMATNRNLENAMKEGKFRADLFYRLSTHVIHIPPLRERKADLPFLLRHFIQKHAGVWGKKPPDYRPDLLDLLGRYHFPGNVRELENIIANAVAVSKGKFLDAEGVKKSIHLEKGTEGKGPDPLADGGFEPIPTLKEVEARHIISALQYTNNNISHAARLLGIDYTTLHRKLKKISPFR